MSSSNFFIRKTPKDGPGAKKGKKLKRKGLVYSDKNANKSKKVKPKAEFEDEEITSEEEENYEKSVPQVDTDEDEYLTPQEKKLKLAKQYLKEIEEQEKEKNDTDEVDQDVILGRLRNDVLSQAGRLKQRIYDKLKLSYVSEDIQVLKCKEHKLSITALAVSNDFIYSGSKDGSIVKWCLKTKNKIGKISPRYLNKSDVNLHDSAISCLAVSGDGKFLASGDDSMDIRMWDANSLNYVFSFKGHRGGVTGIAFCRLSQNLYSCSKDRTVKVWSVNERAYIETLFGHQNPITDLDVLGKDRVVTSGGVDGTARIWKIQEESQLIFNGHSRSIDSVRRLGDMHFVTGGDEGSICLWGALKKKPLVTINPAHGIDPISQEAYWITAIGCIQNTEIFASGSSNGSVQLWKCDDGYKGASSIASIPVVGFVNAIAFTQDLKQMIVGVGQEHKLGRWSRIKEAKNSILVINIQQPD